MDGGLREEDKDEEREKPSCSRSCCFFLFIEKIHRLVLLRHRHLNNCKSLINPFVISLKKKSSKINFSFSFCELQGACVY